jgi:hypothetical protein
MMARVVNVEQIVNSPWMNSIRWKSNSAFRIASDVMFIYVNCIIFTESGVNVRLFPELLSSVESLYSDLAVEIKLIDWRLLQEYRRLFHAQHFRFRPPVGQFATNPSQLGGK